MTDCHSIILRIIKSYRGDSNKRTQAEITDECNAMGGDITERRTRIILRELIDAGAPMRARNMNRNCLAEKARKKEIVQLSWLERVR